MEKFKLKEVKRSRDSPKLDAHIAVEYTPSQRQALNKMFLRPEKKNDPFTRDDQTRFTMRIYSDLLERIKIEAEKQALYG